jgi:hypothetical protein
MMDSWYRITTIEGGAVENAFLELWLAARWPKGAALFSARPRKQRPRTEDMYFTPDAARIAWSLVTQYGGTECPRPKAGLGLCVGDQSAIELLED